jgi:rubrerythrin
MEIKLTLKKVGTGYMFYVPKFIREQYELSIGDDLLIEIKNKVIKIWTGEIISYRCKVCEHYFSSDDEIPYCPICGDTNTLEEVKEDLE